MIEKALPRVIFIGESSVGKTSIITRATTGVFDPNTAATIGAGVQPISVEVDGRQHKFHLWDTAGQEIFRSIVPLYFKQAVCAIVVFSLADQKSFDALPEWIDLLNSHSERNVPVVIVGNKKDIEHAASASGNASEMRFVEVQDVKKFCNDKKYPFFFTSAVTGENIKNLFEFIAEKYIANIHEPEVTSFLSSEDEKKQCC